MSKNKKTSPGTIAQNKRARFEYFIEETVEAGVSLQGWEVKSLRQGKANISDSYVTFKNGEAFLFGATIVPLISSSTHVVSDPARTRKLLLKKREISKLRGLAEQDGYTVVTLSLYWKGPFIKASIGVAKGKKTHDKRDTAKDREWKIQKERVLKSNNLR